MKLFFPLAAVAAFALFASLALSGCTTPEPPTDGQQDGTTAPAISFASSEPPTYTMQELCSTTCDEFDYNSWAVRVDAEGRHSCTCSKEVCRREETASVIYKYCSPIEYRFYFSG